MTDVCVAPSVHAAFEVVPVPVLSDNFAYLLIDRSQQVCAAVDPAEADKVYARATELQLKITHILTTHGHWDHAGGNEALVKLITEHEQRSITVVGGQEDAIPSVTQAVDDGDIVHVGNLTVNVLATPCHTRGHVLYHVEDVLFTGDTLFIAGCGRLFQGTPAEMHHALNTVIAQLPPETRIFCGHEYTVSNLRFAQHVEPRNAAVQRKLAWAMAEREAQRYTIPSTIADELETNPFMRVTQPDVQQFAQGAKDPVKVFAVIRAAKDHF